ncbi:MAG TPA: hypothetical protein VIM20_03275, partial [Candidatus Limnocylindrales bacterium]
KKAEPSVGSETASSAAGSDEPAAPKRRTATRKKAEPAGSDGAPRAGSAEAAPKRRTATRTKAAASEPDAGIAGDGAAAAAPKRRATRKKAEPA